MCRIITQQEYNRTQAFNDKLDEAERRIILVLKDLGLDWNDDE